MTVVTDRRAAVRDEAGTAPGDRRFRPDVQGLRAVAILLVVLYHAGIPGISGGYVGVDVFFVISGFVITGLLLRERQTRQHTSIRNFYGRRARRIIPAASLVIIVTVVAAYHYLGSLTGHETAVDGIWSALFLANFHFAATSTNYLASQRPPSALQNYWSLAVEEQFYIVYPTIFLIAARFIRRLSLRWRLTVVLLTIMVASYTYSIVLTSANPSSAFFSPLTRAWELALGGLVAVSGQSLRRLPQSLAALASWLGLAAILVASTTLTSASAYPGWLVALPVLGAGFVIAGGAAQSTWGVETLLRQRPFQFLGLISYSLYLWHWPILIIATQYRGATTLPVWDNVLLLLVAGVLATLTYYFFENPIRHSTFLARRRWASIVMGLCLVAVTLSVTTYTERRPTVDLGNLATASTGSGCPSPSPRVVSQLRSSYESAHLATMTSERQFQSVLLMGDSTSCTMLPGLQAVGPSFGMNIGNGAVVGCGIVSGTEAPVIDGGIDFTRYTKTCQGKVNRVESQAIERDHPSLIVWGSTDERNSVMSGTKQLVAGSPEWRSAMLQRIDHRVQQFLFTGARVVFLLEPPQPHSGTQPNSDDLAYARMNDLLKEWRRDTRTA
jgi:peptidoglycan/LPS O-acetylase OafA/YrhL